MSLQKILRVVALAKLVIGEKALDEGPSAPFYKFHLQPELSRNVSWVLKTHGSWKGLQNEPIVQVRCLLLRCWPYAFRRYKNHTADGRFDVGLQSTAKDMLKLRTWETGQRKRVVTKKWAIKSICPVMKKWLAMPTLEIFFLNAFSRHRISKWAQDVCYWSF